MGSQQEPPEDEPNPYLIAGKKLPWFGNPVIYEDKIRPPTDPSEYDELQVVDHLNRNYNVDTIPRFQKHEGSSTLEVFYDLWFVANVAIFTTLHTVNDKTTLSSYVGYISLLWFDWFMVSIYDVRFLADSVTERAGRAVHMGVMVAFAVVSVNFTPEQQNRTTFKVTAIALAVSRFCLAVRYASVVWHIRHFKRGMRPVLAVAAISFISGWIYFGIAFRFTEGKNSRAFIAWYVIGAVETVLHLLLGLCFKVLSFDGTHLSERMTVSTLFMLGEGVNVLAENIVTIVQNNGWTPATIGNLTAGIAEVYFVFMVYFDWMANHSTLGGIRQALWAVFHFPFHLLLLLFMEGSSQFVQWWKILEALAWARDQFVEGAAHAQDYLDPNDSPTQYVVDFLNTTVTKIFERYTPTYVNTEYEVERVLEEIGTIPDEWWSDTNGSTKYSAYYQELYDNSTDELSTAISNSILVNFKIDPMSGIDVGENTNITTNTQLQTVALQQTSSRFAITFAFTFISAGLTLLFMTFLFIIGRPRRSWSVSVAIRIGLFILISIAISLVVLVAYDEQDTSYINSPWLLPTLALAYFIVVILTHFPRKPTPATFAFWRRARARTQRKVKRTDANAGFEGVRHQQLEGVYTAYEGHNNYDGQPTQVYTTYPMATYGGPPYETLQEKTN
ncbi:bacterial low temperature requirement A protein-domain-containing protein [Astrocystis sublimbata]|nr:bacterial low temperature requirement A protein-domain-containing protein [Astrocystis sublimbata]